MAEKIKVYASLTVLLLGGGFLLYLVLKYAIGVFLPFAFGWAAALLVRKPAAFLHRRTGLSEGALRLLLVISAVTALGGALWLGVKKLLHELTSLAEGALGDIGTLSAKIKEYFSSLPLVGKWLSAGDLLGELLSALTARLPGAVSALVSFLPSLVLGLSVGMIAAVYFCLDLNRIHAAIHRLIPAAMRAHFHRVKSSAFGTAFAVLKADAALMGIAFLVMFVGFSLINVKYSLLLAGVFAIFDFLPVIGIGTFLIPFALLSFVMGNYGQGVGILVIYLVASIARQLAEPRLLGKGFGVHPLLTLLSMYVGARFFGALGLLLFPALTAIVYRAFFTLPAKK